MKQFFAPIFGITFGLLPAVDVGVAEDTVEIYVTAEQLTQYCRAFLTTQRLRRGTVGEYRDAGICYGFVTGVADAIELSGVGQTTRCLPKGANANTLAEIVGVFLDKNPTLRNGDGYGLAVRAISEAYHCSMITVVTVVPQRGAASSVPTPDEDLIEEWRNSTACTAIDCQARPAQTIVPWARRRSQTASCSSGTLAANCRLTPAAPLVPTIGTSPCDRPI